MKKVTADSEIFTRGVADIVTREELLGRLKRGKPLRVKHGIDATAGELHIGHAASLWKLRALQEDGHKAVILFGDTTTAIGDPTGRSKARPVLSAEKINANVRSIEKQVRAILLTDPSVYEAHKSSKWYARMPTPEFLCLLSMVTHARVIERDMFRERIKTGAEIFLNEMVYPVLQGYDSVKLRADMTIIGHDQLFNEHLGRFLQEKFGQAPQVIVALSLLPGLDGGEKMSKSLGNHLGLLDSPQDKFGKAMRLRDSLIILYLEHYTDISLPVIRALEKNLKGGRNFMDAKLFLASALVKRYHGETVARREREKFLSFFSRKETPADIPIVKLPPGAALALQHLLTRLKLAGSATEARRLILGGAVEINGSLVKDPKLLFDLGGSGAVVRVGKRKMVRIK